MGTLRPPGSASSSSFSTPSQLLSISHRPLVRAYGGWSRPSCSVAFPKSLGGLGGYGAHTTRRTLILSSCSALSAGRKCARVHQLPYRVTTTIIAPSFLTAAIFNVLGLIIRRVGTQYSWLPPRWCKSVPFPAPVTLLISHSYVDLIIFISLDFAALIVQAIGGGKASIAAQNGEDPEPGGDIMMYGIIIQMIGMTLVCTLALNQLSRVHSHPPQFCILSADFLFRFYWNKPVRSAVSSSQINSRATSSMPASSEKTFPAFPAKVRLMLLSAGMTTVWVLIRSIYRTIELADGWTGQIITTQVYFNLLDGAPIVLAMVTLNALHPGWLLREENRSGPGGEGSQSTLETVRV